MKQARPIVLLICVLALALSAAWYFSRGEGVRSNAVDLTEQETVSDQSSSLAMPEGQAAPHQDRDSVVIEPDRQELPVAPTVMPVLDNPDYGPGILRGGAFVDFELYDANGLRVPVQGFGARLWRKVGSYWVAEEATIKHAAGVISCDGLGEAETPPVGIEPGTYELELTSEYWGNIRHEFIVLRGERRIERLTTPHTKVNVCFRFTDASGLPVAYLPATPSVTTTAQPLEPRERPEAPRVALRTPPGGGRSGSGSYWSTRGSGSGYPHKYEKPPLFPTDDGGWWVTVFAGGTNTVTFKLHELWGQEEYQLVDTFTSRSEILVQLPTVPDFAARVLEWGEPLSWRTPGDRKTEEATTPKPEFDPHTAPVAADSTRILVQVDAAVPVKVELSLDGATYWNVMYQRESDHWYDISAGRDLWIRFADGRLLCTAWEKIDVALGGLQQIVRQVNGPLVTLRTDGLTPTLRAFAHTVQLDVVADRPPQPAPVEDPVEDPKISKEADINDDPVDSPRGELSLDQESRLYTPAGKDVVFRVVIRGETDTIADSVALNNSGLASGVQLRTHLRGVSRYRKGRQGSSSRRENGLHWFEPVVLHGSFAPFDTGGMNLISLLQSGTLQPRFDNVLVARAVGPQQEGLPWVSGVILDYEKDEIAQQVRKICEDISREPDVIGGEDYATRLAAVEAAERCEGLRELIGDDAFDAFQTNEQRLWFARNGAWYDSHRKVYSDDHGYVARQSPGLEPGKCYVLYLWSNSRNTLRPDARFAFKVDDNGVADLGAISMPTFTD